MSTPIVISGPAAPETLRILRTVAASLGARSGMSFDRIDELRITVDEAATLILRAGGATTLTLELDRDDPPGLRCRIYSDAVVPEWPGERSSSWAWRVVSELSTEAAMSLVEGCPEITFSWFATDPAARGGEP